MYKKPSDDKGSAPGGVMGELVWLSQMDDRLTDFKNRLGESNDCAEQYKHERDVLSN